MACRFVCLTKNGIIRTEKKKSIIKIYLSSVHLVPGIPLGGTDISIYYSVSSDIDASILPQLKPKFLLFHNVHFSYVKIPL